MLRPDPTGGRPPATRTLAWCLAAFVLAFFLGGAMAGSPDGDGLLPVGAVDLPDEPGAADGSAEEEHGCDCPDDDEEGECPSGCDACSCCPAAAPPGSSPPEHTAVFAGAGGDAQLVLAIDAAQDGQRGRIFHPPRS